MNKKRIAIIAPLILTIALSLSLLPQKVFSTKEKTQARCLNQEFNFEMGEDISQQIAERFWPTLVFHTNESTKSFLGLYQLVDNPLSDTITLTMSVVYSLDGGTDVIVRPPDTVGFLPDDIVIQEVDQHNGDVQTVKMTLKVINRGEESLRVIVASVVIKNHTKWMPYLPSYFTCNNGLPVVYVSLGKHSMYPTLDECQKYGIIEEYGFEVTIEQCDRGATLLPVDVAKYDVGYGDQRIDPFQYPPLSQEFPNESAWDDCFYGGLGDKQGCRASFAWE